MCNLLTVPCVHCVCCRFDVSAAVDAEGALTVQLSQGDKRVTSWDRWMAGNPQGAGVPVTALQQMQGAMGSLARPRRLTQVPLSPACYLHALTTACMH